MSDRVEKITVTVEPWHFDDRRSEIRVEVSVGRVTHTHRQVLDLHDAESLLERALKRSSTIVAEEVRKQLEAE